MQNTDFNKITPKDIIDAPVKDCTNCDGRIKIGEILGDPIFTCREFFTYPLNEMGMWREGEGRKL